MNEPPARNAIRSQPFPVSARAYPTFSIPLLLALPLVSAQQPSHGTPANPPAPIAIVPADVAANVTGASQINQGKAIITSNGAVTSGTRTTDVLLPRRGTLHVCAATTVTLSTDRSIPTEETPGLMIAMDHGALETSFAIGRNSDIILTPDFRILIGGPGSSELKVRLGEHGDTCVDNPGTDAPYVVVSSVFEGGAYRVQPGQRVMFQHGRLNEVVDQEKEPCGCPAAPRPNSNEFPLAQSAGMAPLDQPTVPQTPLIAPKPTDNALNAPLVYSAPQAAQPPAAARPKELPTPAPPAPAAPTSKPKASAAHKPGVFRSIGRFFKRIFGAE